MISCAYSLRGWGSNGQLYLILSSVKAVHLLSVKQISCTSLVEALLYHVRVSRDPNSLETPCILLCVKLSLPSSLLEKNPITVFRISAVQVTDPDVILTYLVNLFRFLYPSISALPH